MAFIRFIGVFIFLLGLIAFAVDGTKSLASDGEVVITSLEEFWMEVHSKSFDSFQVAAEGVLPAFLNDTILDSILSFPLWVILGILGVLLSWLGRKRTRTSAFIN
ncbi:MAG: hypothetical protein ACRBBN_13380 [Methyloligellaceae bacterium]